MNVAQLADQLRKDSMFMKDVTRWEVIPARRARTAPFPACMDGRLKPALESRGIHELYIHQVRSLEATDRGEDVTVVTPTASGKTMCYNLPVLSAILILAIALPKKDGAMSTGWMTIDKKKFYFGSDGKMRTGWAKIKKEWYYFAANGAMYRGWLLLDGNYYYLDKDGVMVTGRYVIDGVTYRFASNGVLIQ